MPGCCCCRPCLDDHRARIDATFSGWTNNHAACGNCGVVNQTWPVIFGACVVVDGYSRLVHNTVAGGFGFPSLCGGFVELRTTLNIEYHPDTDIGSVTIYVWRTATEIMATYYYEQSGRLDCDSITDLHVPLESKDATYCDAGSDDAVITAAGAIL
jgi:hypothetical protein